MESMSVDKAINRVLAAADAWERAYKGPRVQQIEADVELLEAVRELKRLLHPRRTSPTMWP